MPPMSAYLLPFGNYTKKKVASSDAVSTPLTSEDKQGESHPRWLQTSHAAAAIQQPQTAPGRVTHNKSQTVL